MWGAFARKGKKRALEEEDCKIKEEGIALYGTYEQFSTYPFKMLTKEQAIKLRKGLHDAMNQVFHPERLGSNSAL
jgi:hypothetical protein